MSLIFYLQINISRDKRWESFWLENLGKIKNRWQRDRKKSISLSFFCNSRRLQKTSKKGEIKMNIYVYAGFTYLLTAAIALLMIGAVVLLNKVMGGNNSDEGEIN